MAIKNTELELYNTLAQMFYSSAVQHAGKKMFFSRQGKNWRGLDADEIRDVVRQVTFALRYYGVKPGVRVAIYGKNSPRLLMADYSIVCAGGVSVILHPDMPVSQLEFILNDSKAGIIFIENIKLKRKLDKIWPKIKTLRYAIMIDDDKHTRDDRVLNFSNFQYTGKNTSLYSVDQFKDQIQHVEPKFIFTLAYTPATGGYPKAVELNHRNAIATVKILKKILPLTNKDMALSTNSINHIFERVLGNYLLFNMGVPISFSEDAFFIEDIKEVNPSILMLTHKQAESLPQRLIAKSKEAGPKKLFGWGGGSEADEADENSIPPKKWKTLTGGKLAQIYVFGGSVNDEVKAFYEEHAVEVREVYGTTETCAIVSINNVQNQFKDQSAGVAIPGINIKVAQNGEILVKGTNVMPGYYHAPEVNELVKDSKGWFHTGDLGEIDEDGFITVHTRVDDLIYTKQYGPINPEEIESVILRSEYIKQAVIIGRDRPFLSLLLVPEFDKLQTWVNENSAGSVDPKEIVINPQVVELLSDALINELEDFGDFQGIQKMFLVPRELQFENGEINQLGKPVRRIVERRFQSIIDAIYE